jgi:hypothetical protein
MKDPLLHINDIKLIRFYSFFYQKQGELINLLLDPYYRQLPTFSKFSNEIFLNDDMVIHSPFNRCLINNYFKLPGIVLGIHKILSSTPEISDFKYDVYEKHLKSKFFFLDQPPTCYKGTQSYNSLLPYLDDFPENRLGRLLISTQQKIIGNLFILQVSTMIVIFLIIVMRFLFKLNAVVHSVSH